jgi:hypothetical protein
MPKSPFLHLQEIIRAVTDSKSRHECRLKLDRARSEMAEISTATQRAIDESRELMAAADAVVVTHPAALFTVTGAANDGKRQISTSGPQIARTR